MLAAVVLAFTLFVGTKGTYEQNKGPRCYDCNYAPSGYVLSKNGYSGGHVGYQSCALQTDYDRNSVDKWGCKSGKCFIRRDYNGLVYRGCADDGNLPWGVNAHIQCQYQGDNKSLWWFCEGDLCNEGQLGDNEVMCGTPMQSAATRNQGSVQSYESHGKSGQAPSGYGFNEVEVPVYEPEGQGAYVHISFDMGEVDDEAYAYAASMCNGDCSYNPTGLYPYPGDSSKFIQCETRHSNNNACTCCKPTTLSCPHGTEYDDSIKVCTSNKSHLQGYSGYQ